MLWTMHEHKQRLGTMGKSHKLSLKATCQDPISSLMAAKVTAVSLLRSRLPPFPAEAPFCRSNPVISRCMTLECGVEEYFTVGTTLKINCKRKHGLLREYVQSLLSAVAHLQAGS